MFEMKIEDITYVDWIEVKILTQGQSVVLRARYKQNDDYIVIDENRHRISPIRVKKSMEIEDREDLKNEFFDWLISDDGTNFLRTIFEVRPPKVA